MRHLQLPATIKSAGVYSTYCQRNKNTSIDEMIAMLRAENRQFRQQQDDLARQLQAEAWEIWAKQSQQLIARYKDTGHWPDEAEAMILADRDLRLSLIEEDSRFDAYEAVLNGRLGRGLIQPGPVFWNKVTRGYLVDTEGARLCNAHTSNEDGIIYYLAVGTNNTDATETDSAMGRETFRKAPDTKKNTSSGSKLILKLDFTEANLTAITAVQPGTHTLNTFGVDSTTGFNVGDVIEVGTSPAKSYARISSITPGTPGSFTTDTNLLSIPTEDQTVTLWLGEFAAWGNGLASGTLGTGTLFSRSANASTRIEKNEDLAWFIKFHFIRTVV